MMAWYFCKKVIWSYRKQDHSDRGAVENTADTAHTIWFGGVISEMCAKYENFLA